MGFLLLSVYLLFSCPFWAYFICCQQTFAGLIRIYSALSLLSLGSISLFYISHPHFHLNQYANISIAKQNSYLPVYRNHVNSPHILYSPEKREILPSTVRIRSKSISYTALKTRLPKSNGNRANTLSREQIKIQRVKFLTTGKANRYPNIVSRGWIHGISKVPAIVRPQILHSYNKA